MIRHKVITRHIYRDIVLDLKDTRDELQNMLLSNLPDSKNVNKTLK